MPEVKQIPVIEEFLQQWKQRAIEYYSNTLIDFIKVKEAYNDTVDSWNGRYYNGVTEEQRQEIISNHEEKCKTLEAFQKLHGHLMDIIWGNHPDDYNKLIEKSLNKEVENKRKTLIARIEKKAGNIIDANYLTIGVNGEINGTITGEIATVTVNTIYAGGYNIQCLHYRVLVK